MKVYSIQFNIIFKRIFLYENHGGKTTKQSIHENLFLKAFPNKI